MSSNIKPFVALGLTVAGTALVANFQVSEQIPLTAAAPADPTITAASTTGRSSRSTTAGTATSRTSANSSTSSTSSTSAKGMATPSAVPSSPGTSTSTAYADGTYTGSAVREPWGTFEVQVTVTAGEVTAVSLVAAPNDRHSSSINSYAVPQLTQEVLATQTSDIDWVSGATWTSQSYTTSLQAALDSAAAKA